MSLSTALVMAGVACKGTDNSRVASGGGSGTAAGTKPRPSDAAPSHPRLSKLEQKREELLMLDAALTKVEKEIKAARDASDPDAVAKLRSKEELLRKSLEGARKDLELLEFMHRQNQQQKEASGSDG